MRTAPPRTLNIQNKYPTENFGNQRSSRALSRRRTEVTRSVVRTEALATTRPCTAVGTAREEEREALKLVALLKTETRAIGELTENIIAPGKAAVLISMQRKTQVLTFPFDDESPPRV